MKKYLVKELEKTIKKMIVKGQQIFFLLFLNFYLKFYYLIIYLLYCFNKTYEGYNLKNDSTQKFNELNEIDSKYSSIIKTNIQ